VERIKYYPTNDLMCGNNLSNIENIIKKFEGYKAEKEALDINDMIELYNVKKYFDNEIYLKDWSNENISYYKNTINKLFRIVARYFKSIAQEDFIVLYKKVKRYYRDDFWELIDKFKVYESIDELNFEEIINLPEVWLYELLKHKKIVEYFGKTIRQHMLNDCSSAELLLDEFEMKHISDKDPLNFPKELNSTDKEIIINNYIESENPNLNYLRLIANMQSNKDKIEISPKTLLKAKKKAENQEGQLFTEDSKMNIKLTVVFSESQDEEVIVKRESQSITAKYNTKWIKNNTDYATLLNNFIYLFEFVDWQMRFTLVNKFNHMSVFERFGFISSKNAYKTGIEFNNKNILSLLQIKGYYNELFGLGIRLEEVIEWFFIEYLVKEFNASKFKITMPSSNSTMLEKCTIIMPGMESVLKQFSLFVQEGEIDFELLEIRSEPLVYNNIPSLVDKKYVYGIGEEYKTVTFLLFSDQGELGYNEKNKKTYNNFFELLRNEKLKLKDYPDYCVKKINWLIDHKYLSTNEEGYIIFKDKLLIIILKDLYFNEVINYWRYPDPGRLIMDELEKKNIIEFESTLFSRPEQAYINYFLNKSQFNNGLDLRNKYVHTQPSSDDNENVHNNNYMILLRLFILTVIKINDDFCISDELKDN